MMETTRETSGPQRRWRSVAYGTAVMLAGAFSAVCYLAAVKLAELSGPTDLQAGTIGILARPEAVSSFVGLGLLGGLALFVLFVVAQLRRSPNRLRYLALVGALAQVWYLPGWLFFDLGRWRVEDHVTGADGRTYYFLHESVLTGYSWALGERVSSNPFSVTVRMLGGHAEHTPGTDPAVVRPEPLKPGGEDFRMYRGGDWVAGLTGQHCLLAYNTRTRQFYNREDLARLSPFFLIGPKSRAHQPDLQRLTRVAQQGRSE